MAEPLPTVQAVVRQMRRVRWRRNLQVLQRALYLGVAAGAGAAALLVLLGLLAPATPFVLGGAALGAALLLCLGLVLRDAAGGWLGAGLTPLWIDQAGGLEGRLATLVGIARRGPRPDEAFLLPLLEAQNHERLATWRPERLLPGDMPVGPAVAALAGVGLLSLVLALAPRLAPRLPEIVERDQPVRLVETGDLGTDADRLLVAPEVWGHGREGGPDAVPAGGAEGAAPSAIARLATGLQDRLRERLWGESWTRAREALARAERARAEGLARAEGGAGTRWERARTGRGHAGRSGTEPGDQAVGGAARDARPAGDAAASPGGEDGAEASDAPGAGAGTGTDPDLLGVATEGAETDDTFELAITARVRATRLAPRPPSGEAPPAAPDARPALSTRQRREAAVHKPVVPPLYEAIVREAYAHGETP